MKYSTFCTISLFCATASVYGQYAPSSVTIGSSTSDMLWSTAAWSAGSLPDSNTATSISVGDALNAFAVDQNVEVANLTLRNNTWLLVDGKSISTLATGTDGVYGDLFLYDNSKATFKNGASLSVAGGSSLQIKENASVSFDASTFTGKLHGSFGSLSFSNGSTWNASTYSTGIVSYGSVLVDASTINLTGSFGMNNGATDSNVKVFTMQNGSKLVGNNMGIDLAGTFNLYDTSSMSGISHFNLGSGTSVGKTVFTLKGTDALNRATVTASNGWINSGVGSDNKIVLDGFSSIAWGKIDSNNKYAGGDVSILFNNSYNDFTISGEAMWGDNTHKNFNALMSGAWLMSVSDGASFNNFKVTGTLNLNASAASQSSHIAGIDWSGENNSLTANNINVKTSTAADTTVKTYLAVRDKATATVSGTINVASTDGGSGTATVSVGNGALLTAGTLNINNSTVLGSTALSEFIVDGGTFAFSSGKDFGVGSNVYLGGTARAIIKNGGTLSNVNRIFIGLSNVSGGNGKSELVFDNTAFTPPNELHIGTGANYVNSLSGNATLKLQNGASVTTASKTKIYQTNNSDSTGVSKLLIDSSTYKTTNEIFLGAHSDFGGSYVVNSGTAIIEVTGTNATLESVNKTIYHGYNSVINGGEAKILLSGENNKIQLSTTGTDKTTFYMSSAGSAVQHGGSFDVSITGSNNVFESNGIIMGAAASTAGRNSVYIKGDSSTAKNTVSFVGGYTLEMRGSSVASSTIENSFEMAGNAILNRPAGETVSIQLASSAAYAGGTAKFVVSGVNNEIVGYKLNIGHSGSTGGKAIFRIEGSTHSLNFGNELKLSGGSGTSASASIGGRLEYVFDNVGISALNVGSVTEFNGVIEIDFSKLLGVYDGTEDSGKFLLISSGSGWENAFNAWLANTSNYAFEFRDDSDSASLVYENGDLYVYYTSSIPEPATYALLLGALSLAFAAYKRRK